MASFELFLQDRHVGTVAPDARDRTRVTLSIDRDYKQEILLSEAFAALAGRKPPVDAVSNFLGGYVPEGKHREQMAAKRHVDKDDLFALLNEFGGSIAGAVTLRRPDEDPGFRPAYEPLDDRAPSLRAHDTGRAWWVIARHHHRSAVRRALSPGCRVRRLPLAHGRQRASGAGAPA